MLKSFLSLSSLTLLSRVSGFVKVAALAAFYGRNVEADMFMAVMLIPDLIYKFISEGIVSCSAVPIFAERSKEKKNISEAFWTLVWIVTAISLIITLILIIFSSMFCKCLIPGFDVIFSERLQFMWSVSSLYVLASLPAAVLTSYLNTCFSFALPAVGPLIVNIAIIVGIFFANGGPIETIIYSNIIGAILQFFWLIWLVKRNETFRINFKDIFKYDKKLAIDFLKGSTPIGIWICSLALFPIYERYLLSMQDEGALAALNYSEKLFNLPLGIISISLANVILPRLSVLEGSERKKNLLRYFMFSLISIVPIILIIWGFADYIVSIVYRRGKFSFEDSNFAASLFRSYSLALLPVSLNMVLNRGFFAAKKYFIPFIAGMSASITLFYLGEKLVFIYGVSGIGYAASVAYFVQTIILFVCTIL